MLRIFMLNVVPVHIVMLIVIMLCSSQTFFTFIVFMLSIAMFCVLIINRDYADCHNAKQSLQSFFYAECHRAEHFMLSLFIYIVLLSINMSNDVISIYIC
jgi:hypothetical protein